MMSSRRNSDVRQARWDGRRFATCVGNDITVSCSARSGGRVGRRMGRPGTCWTPIDAMTLQGHGLAAAHRHEEHLVVVEAQLAIARRAEAVEQAILNIKDNVANCYRSLGRQDEALAIRSFMPGRWHFLFHPLSSTCAFSTFPARCSIARRHAEAKCFPAGAGTQGATGARRGTQTLRLKLCLNYGQAICFEGSREDVVESTTLLERRRHDPRRRGGSTVPRIRFAETVRLAFVASKQALVHFDVAGGLDSHTRGCGYFLCYKFNKQPLKLKHRVLRRPRPRPGHLHVSSSSAPSTTSSSRPSCRCPPS